MGAAPTSTPSPYRPPPREETLVVGTAVHPTDWLALISQAMTVPSAHPAAALFCSSPPLPMYTCTTDLHANALPLAIPNVCSADETRLIEPNGDVSLRDVSYFSVALSAPEKVCHLLFHLRGRQAI